MNKAAYLQDGAIIIRPMLPTDPPVLQAEFEAQGWKKPLSVLNNYYAQQENGVFQMVVAELDGQPAGYTVLMSEAVSGPYTHCGIPCISDFVVFKRFQRRGIGSRILDVAEQLAFQNHDAVCLGVGLHSGYGAAHVCQTGIYSRRQRRVVPG